MDKVEQKFKKYILANKILATIFAAICVCSIAVFAIYVANCPNWLVYVLVFLLCAILPICVFYRYAALIWDTSKTQNLNCLKI